MDVLKPVFSLGKLLAGITLAFFACGERQPLILCAGLVWYAWLRHKELVSRQKLLASLGLGFIAIGWSIGWFVRYYGVKAGGTHFPGQGDDWMMLASLSFWISFGAITLGVIALACVDAVRQPSVKPKVALPGEPELRQDQVWPPAPKQS